MQEITQVTYGEGTVTVIMSAESATEIAAPDIRFGDYYDSVIACFTAKELGEIEAGTNAQLEFDCLMTDEPSDSAENKHFEDGIKRAEISKGTLQKGFYIEVEAEKTLGDEEADEIDILYDDVEVQFEIPLYLVAEKRVYYAMIDVMGECDLYEDIDEAASTLSISTHNMGTTLILYQDQKDIAQKNSSKFMIKSQYIFVIGIIALALLWWKIDRRYRRDRD